MGIVVDEELAFFPCGDSQLAGLLTRPIRPNGIGVVIAWGAGAIPSSGRNRMRTRLARILADKGFHALRFDYLGVGESAGEFRQARLSDPYIDEIEAACDWLRSKGPKRLAIVGNCFGAWSLLQGAPRIQSLVGVAVINSPVRHDHKQAVAAKRPLRWWLKNIRRVTPSKLRNAGRRAHYRRMVGAKVAATLGIDRVDTRFLHAVKGLVDRDLPLLVVYGQGGFTSEFEAELLRGLRPVLDKGKARVVIADHKLDGYPSLASQEVVIDTVVNWLEDLAADPDGTR